MMIIVKKLSILFILMNLFGNSWAQHDQNNDERGDSFVGKGVDESGSSDLDDEQILDLTTDSRIKTYIYNSNEVYLLMLHYGFQLNIEFAKGERVQTISLGDTYSWKITPLDNLLFIRPLEKDIRTNMTVITNKNTYYFDLISQDPYINNESDPMYLVRFYYPKKLMRNGKR